MKQLRSKLKKIAWLKRLVISLRLFKNRYSIPHKAILIRSFFKDFKAYKVLPRNEHWKLQESDLYPCIYDKTETHTMDPVYFYQDAWCAGKVFANKPVHHWDIGSQAHMIGIISQFVPTTMIDIRPLTLTSLKNLHFVTGSVLDLPFKDGEIRSLSSICVLEHIGLGRYGDPIDQFGSEKAFAEMKRVLAPDGDLYISVPVDAENKVFFNAHRAFTRDYVLELFKGLMLAEEKYIYGDKIMDLYDAQKGFGTGLYHFKK
ncbi:MAG: DUF268 domain-containing protein [Candidatus Pacebacteria bacterium]|nr:DUF268 domain-containing protein [Candidatus Paceibacterota bacterium]